MNLREIHTEGKELSAKALPSSLKARITSIQILKNGLLREHLTKEPALLVCVFGEAVYEDENGKEIPLLSGDFHEITPMVKHWVKAIEDSQLLLIK